MNETLITPETTSAPPADPLCVAVYLADQNPHRDRSLGITTMTDALMQQLILRDDLRLRQVISSSSYRAALPGTATVRLPVRTDRPWGRLFVDGFHPWLRMPPADVWYYPKGYAPRFSRPDRPLVGTMHDTIVQHYADHYSGSRSRRAFRYWIDATRRSLIRFDAVLTVSHHAAGQLRTFCDRYDIAAPPIHVTYEGTPWERFRHMTFEKQNQVIHLASTSPHKRTADLLRLWNVMRQHRRELPALVLVGPLDRTSRGLAESLAEVTTHPRLPRDELRDLVGRSRALLLPSEIEGFGLPLLEAYYVGTPVCYCAGTAVDEVMRCATGNIDGPDAGPPGAFTMPSPESFSAALDQVLRMDQEHIARISDQLFDRYATHKVAHRIARLLRSVARGGENVGGDGDAAD